MTPITKEEAMRLARSSGLVVLAGFEDALAYFALAAERQGYNKAIKDVADFIRPQRNGIPATGEEFAATIENMEGRSQARGRARSDGNL